MLTFREWQVGFYLLLLLPNVMMIFFFIIFYDLSPTLGQKYGCQQGRLFVSSRGKTTFIWMICINQWPLISFMVDHLPIVRWRQQQCGDQEGDQSDILHHHSASICRQVWLRSYQHHKRGGHGWLGQVSCIEFFKHYHHYLSWFPVERFHILSVQVCRSSDTRRIFKLFFSVFEVKFSIT